VVIGGNHGTMRKHGMCYQYRIRKGDSGIFSFESAGNVERLIVQIGNNGYER
jgi:hypothetical protein